MITLKVIIKEVDKDNIHVSIEPPKSLAKATENEKIAGVEINKAVDNALKNLGQENK